MAVGIAKGINLPIGVDLGTSALKLAQLRVADGTYDLLGAGLVDIPPECRADLQARLDFCASALRRLLRAGGFRGRKCVLSIPAAATFVHHLKVPKGSQEQVRKAALEGLRGKLPFPVAEAEIRHVVAGDVGGEGEARQEVIVVAARRETLMAQLDMARHAGLKVAGVNVESCAIVECFARLFQRASDQDRVILFVDVGYASTQVVLSHGHRIVFARDLPLAGEYLDQSVAEGMGISQQEAHEMRREVADNDEADGQADEVHQHLLEALETLGDELTKCIRYYEAVFGNRTIEGVIFLGGQATDKRLCRSIAERLNLPAQVGDPLVRVGGVQAGGLNAGLDRRGPQPRWAVAIGLSLGAAKAA